MRTAFFDSNILVYADDTASPAKQARAVSLFADYWKHEAAVISLQVIQEYFSAATRKLGVTAETAQRKVELLARGRVVQFTGRDVTSAIELHRLNRLSFWDAMIVHAARLANASVLYSEDMQHGAILGGVRVENPFLEIQTS
jgi:predicted nucleic acid-binding protein